LKRDACPSFSVPKISPSLTSQLKYERIK